MTPRPFGDVLEKVQTIDGWLTPDQAKVLYDTATQCVEGDQIVEIGSFRGRSTVVLALAASDGVRIVAIDPHAGNDRGPREIKGFVEQAAQDHQVFMANLSAAGVRDRVTHLRATSSDALASVEGNIAVLYVDGAHRYAPAHQDIRDWGARVRDGGILLIHDSYSAVGLTLAIVRTLMFGSRFRYVGRTRSLSRYRADLQTGIGPRSRNAMRQISELPWFAKNVLLKVLLTMGLGKLLGAVGRRQPEWPY